jgi:hypothetical protein
MNGISMSQAGISDLSTWLAQQLDGRVVVGQSHSTNSASSAGAASAGSPPGAASQGGALMNDILQALAEIGISGNSDSTATSSSALSSASPNANSASSRSTSTSASDTAQELQSFMLSLLAVLQAQSAGSIAYRGASKRRARAYNSI